MWGCCGGRGGGVCFCRTVEGIYRTCWGPHSLQGPPPPCWGGGDNVQLLHLPIAPLLMETNTPLTLLVLLTQAAAGRPGSQEADDDEGNEIRQRHSSLWLHLKTQKIQNQKSQSAADCVFGPTRRSLMRDALFTFININGQLKRQPRCTICKYNGPALSLHTAERLNCQKNLKSHLTEPNTCY